MATTRRKWRANRRTILAAAQSGLLENRTMVQLDNARVECMVTFDLVPGSVVDPGVRLGNVALSSDFDEDGDDHRALANRRAIEQSNLRIPCILVSDENATLDEFSQVPFGAYKIITAVTNMGMLGKWLPQTAQTDMGDFMVGDPITLQLNLVEETLTLTERISGKVTNHDMSMIKLKLKVWPSDNTCVVSPTPMYYLWSHPGTPRGLTSSVVFVSSLQT